jgi:hypothetical protein
VDAPPDDYTRYQAKRLGAELHLVGAMALRFAAFVFDGKCVEEMTGRPVPKGALFYGGRHSSISEQARAGFPDRRRREATSVPKALTVSEPAQLSIERYHDATLSLAALRPACAVLGL